MSFHSLRRVSQFVSKGTDKWLHR